MTNVNIFETAKQSLVIQPKTQKEQAFVYRTIADLENLIGFVGTTPKVDIDKGKMVLTFKKHIIGDGSVVLRNSYGEVTRVMTFEEANKIYDVAAQSEFLQEHKNKVVAKIKPEKVAKK
jgi:hypothetical protein